MAYVDAYDRLQAHLERIGASKRDLARMLDRHESVIFRAFNKHSGLERHWAAICNHYAIDADWLLLGRQPEAPRRARDGDGTACGDGTLVRCVTTLHLLGDVTAGPGDIWVAPDDAQALALPAALSVVRIHGDSGAPAILDGQMAVLAGPDRRPQNGDIVCLQTRGGEAFCKRMQRDKRRPERIVLMPVCGQGHDVAIVEDEEISAVRVVIGVLFEVPR